MDFDILADFTDCAGQYCGFAWDWFRYWLGNR